MLEQNWCLVDSHCHLDCLTYNEQWPNLAAIMAEARAANIDQMLCVCITLDNFESMCAQTESFEQVLWSVGQHPCDVDQNKIDRERLLALGQHQRVVALGETGLDYFHMKSPESTQKEAFAVHIDVAKRLNKPLIIHSRDAREDTIAVMRAEGASEVGGVMHCFTETWEMAKQALDCGFYISFSGIITFKNAEVLRDVVKKVPMDRLLIETDAPYLAPDPFRGKPNYPQYVCYVAEKVAELKQMSMEEVARQTWDNFQTLFHQ